MRLQKIYLFLLIPLAISFAPSVAYHVHEGMNPYSPFTVSAALITGLVGMLIAGVIPFIWFAVLRFRLNTALWPFVAWNVLLTIIMLAVLGGQQMGHVAKG